MFCVVLVIVLLESFKSENYSFLRHFLRHFCFLSNWYSNSLRSSMLSVQFCSLLTGKAKPLQLDVQEFLWLSSRAMWVTDPSWPECSHYTCPLLFFCASHHWPCCFFTLQGHGFGYTSVASKFWVSLYYKIYSLPQTISSFFYRSVFLVYPLSWASMSVSGCCQ